MSDLDKLDNVQNFVQKWVDWAKQNTMIAGFIITGVPVILGAGYTGITKFNEVKDMYEGYSDTSSAAFSAKRKVEALEEKVADPNYGVAKGKVPSKEQTVARRVTTDSREVTQGIDQVMSLTEGGMKNTTGTIFANVKDTGLLTAPVKFFTNRISDKDSAMYDAMMYPLVKGVALYQNPDYRPTDNDVKIAMNAYKAQAGQQQVVQLEKLAELKKNYLTASESFLDSAILNPQQANSLKQQIRYVEKAIPWDVKDVVNFTQQKQQKNFGEYLKSKGTSIPSVDSTKKTESVTVGGQTYQRPTNMSDQDWSDYKKAVGAQ